MAHLYVFYVSWRLWEAHLYVFYVSGRLRGGTDSGDLRARVGPLERTSRVRGEGRGAGEGSGSFVRVLRVLEALGGSFVRILRVREAPGGPNL